MKVIGLRAEALREAVRAIGALRQRSGVAPKQLLNAVRVLPLHLRRHGLLATLAFGMNADKEDKTGARDVANSFARSLGSMLPAAAEGADGSALGVVNRLATAPLESYLLASRVALLTADAWVSVAESLLGTAEGAEGAPTPWVDAAAHVPALHGGGDGSR